MDVEKRQRELAKMVSIVRERKKEREKERKSERANFTRAFYWKNFGVTDFNAVDVEASQRELAKMVSIVREKERDRERET